MNIRKATINDAQALLDIYAPYVKNTAITFEYDVPSLAEFTDRIKTISSQYPYLVAEEDGRIIGYAYAHDFYGRAAYRWSVETTIYMSKESRHQGLGRQLYLALEDELRERGFLNMNACIAYKEAADEFLPSDSIHFHETMGFTHCALFHGSGYKFNRWYDVVWMEKMIGSHENGTAVPPKGLL